MSKKPNCRRLFTVNFINGNSYPKMSATKAVWNAMHWMITIEANHHSRQIGEAVGLAVDAVELWITSIEEDGNGIGDVVLFSSTPTEVLAKVAGLGTTDHQYRADWLKTLEIIARERPQGENNG
jgi:hypothetical protein